jgi:protein phosphatase
VHPWRNVVTRAIGTAPHVEVDGTAVEVEDGDTLLLCSDGLHSVVEEETIRETLAGDEPQKVCESLVEQANALGGPDNVTVVVARLGEFRAQ